MSVVKALHHGSSQLSGSTGHQEWLHDVLVSLGRLPRCSRELSSHSLTTGQGGET
ncbi:hypothetical protein [Streptomyces sp. NPDC012888]|uniref:hypothetical protein n=1 Tax=Streptomyces sp. NPDC012888 TaxID=3364855 RepID=UPI0036C3AD59